MMRFLKPGNKHVVLHAHATAWGIYIYLIFFKFYRPFAHKRSFSVVGHSKPLTYLTVLILGSRSEVIITFLTSAAIFFKIKGQSERLHPTRYQAIQSRLNNSVLDVSGPIRNPRLPLMGFAPAYAALDNRKPPILLSSGKKSPDYLRLFYHRCRSGFPQKTYDFILILVQPFTAYAVEAIRAMKKDLPILAWWTAPAEAHLRLLGPFEHMWNSRPSVESFDGRTAMKAKFEVHNHNQS
ncbi:MAG: hypothetical protein NXY57DRAFT_372860 [Lentinula lateritia]|nr:MAG: hypothetical protein NXY57DRAFT_372860 [Lentinula lateritia]